MKKLLLIFGLLLISFTLLGQNKVQQNYYKSEVLEIIEETNIHIDRLGQTYDWRLSNAACNGCGSFYYAITRTPDVDEEGKYWFYLIMWSNSYYGNGVLATTYVQNINIDVILSDDSNNHVLGPFYAVIKPKTNYYDGLEVVANIWSTEPDIIINVTWGSVQAY